jgi:uncharacterized protein with FMN-binding domain
MRRIVLWAMSTLTVLVLLFSYSTSRSSTAVVAAETRQVTTTSKTSERTGSATVEGDAVMTRFGNVQVKITVTDGRITASDVLQVPWEDRHDQMINSRAVPLYNEEAVQAQSSDIDVVSGATVTWEGYTQSLQSAIDRANI